MAEQTPNEDPLAEALASVTSLERRLQGWSMRRNFPGGSNRIASVARRSGVESAAKQLVAECWLAVGYLGFPGVIVYAFSDHNAVLAWVAKALILPALLCLALAVLRLITGAYAGRKYRAQGKD
jgi:hypothetical protein